ncbi:MAG: hypothetical protein ACK4TL_14710 [Hyphomicrobiaceae bacterium]
MTLKPISMQVLLGPLDSSGRQLTDRDDHRSLLREMPLIAALIQAIVTLSGRHLGACRLKRPDETKLQTIEEHCRQHLNAAA